MARPRSEAKQQAILQAALLEFAENGLAASTAAIAERAGVAAGTLFNYFATKEALQNALYLHLKTEVYGRMNASFPERGSLEARLRHMWIASLSWAAELPAKRRVSIQLALTNVLAPETRQAVAVLAQRMAETLQELERRATARGLPPGFASASMSQLQDAALQLLPAYSKRGRASLMRQAFDGFWRIVR